jgi:hypothetical protein
MRLAHDGTPEEQENRDLLRRLRARSGKPAAIVGGIPIWAVALPGSMDFRPRSRSLGIGTAKMAARKPKSS